MSQPPSQSPLKILIIGAGITGLSTALALSKKNEKHQLLHPTSLPRYEITIVESASELQEIGAGLQIPPNSSRYLLEWGLEDKFNEKICAPKAMVVRKWDDASILGKQPLASMSERFGFPYWYIDRPSYQKILHDAVLETSTKILLSHTLTSITSSSINNKPTAHFLNPQKHEEITADLILGADGIHSPTRTQILSSPIEPLESPSCAYRMTIPLSKMNQNPLTKTLIKETNANLWLNQESNIIGYPIRSNTLYNLVFIRPALSPITTTPSTWSEEASISELRTYYQGWDETVKTLLDLATSCTKWRLAYLPPLSNWVNDSRNVVVLGDAAHAMLLYLAQGAAMGVEDGVAIAECLERVGEVGAEECLRCVTDIPGVLRAFEKVRRGRCEIVAGASKGMEDRAKVKKEDEIREEMSEKGGMSDGEFQSWLYGYDTVVETNRVLDEMFAKEEV